MNGSIQDYLPQLIGAGLFLVGVPMLLILLLPMAVRLAKDGGRKQTSKDPAEELCLDCGYDTRGLVRCPECGRKTWEWRRQQLTNLREQWPTERIAVRIPSTTETPVILFTHENRPALRLLEGHLQARGINSSVEECPDLPGIEPKARRSFYRLVVWSDDRVRAQAIVDHLWPVDAR